MTALTIILLVAMVTIINLINKTQKLETLIKGLSETNEYIEQTVNDLEVDVRILNQVRDEEE